MARRRELSRQALRVLSVIAEMSVTGATGADVHRATRLPSGTIYPVLARLEKDGLLKSWWEEIDPSVVGRPRKRFYRTTALGAKSLRNAVAELSVGTVVSWA
jgi:PadR family transcriptional regulator, regulatory protein PadR